MATFFGQEIKEGVNEIRWPSIKCVDKGHGHSYYVEGDRYYSGESKWEDDSKIVVLETVENMKFLKTRYGVVAELVGDVYVETLFVAEAKEKLASDIRMKDFLQKEENNKILFEEITRKLKAQGLTGIELLRESHEQYDRDKYD